jgi:hypothetical protein
MPPPSAVKPFAESVAVLPLKTVPSIDSPVPLLSNRPPPLDGGAAGGGEVVLHHAARHQ